MSNLNIKRVSGLPSTIEPNTLYFVADATDTKLINIYLSGIDSSNLKHIISKEDIAGLISNAISSLSAIRVVANIAARDALRLTANTMVLVLNATGDPTVTGGGATYLWNIDTRAYAKVSEYESMDMQLKWDSIEGAPTSPVASIDSAVVLAHNHGNHDVLDKLTTDSSGNLMFNGNYASTSFSVVEW